MPRKFVFKTTRVSNGLEETNASSESMSPDRLGIFKRAIFYKGDVVVSLDIGDHAIYRN